MFAARKVPVLLLALPTILGAAGSLCLAELTTVAEREIELVSGGRLIVATRLEDPDYLPGARLVIEPVVGLMPAEGDTESPEVIAFEVVSARSGFAPCHARPESKQLPGACAIGSGLERVAAEGPAFRFRFVNLFQLDETDTEPAFGRAEFRAAVTVRAPTGGVETVRFPISILVRETPLAAALRPHHETPVCAVSVPDSPAVHE